MTGWFAIVGIVAFELVVATVAVKAAARRPRDYFIIAVLAAILVRPFELLVTGDISRVLPDAIWSDGADGKDQIVDASAASAILLPVIAAALILVLSRLIWPAIMERQG